MSGPECQPRRTSVPWGLLGMIGLMLAIESSLEASRDSTTVANAYYQFVRQACREASRAEVLCFGDSLVKVDVLPRVIESRLKQRAYNLAIAGSLPPASFYAFRRALAAGARPEAVLVDFKPSLLPVDPRATVPLLGELLSFRDGLDFYRSTHDANALASLMLVEQLASYRCRGPIRANVMAALLGNPSPTRALVEAHWRNWAANKGTHIFPKSPDAARVAEFWDEKGCVEAGWRCDPANAAYIVKFLRLAAAHRVRVYWLIPPIHPRVHAKREQLGLNARFTKFVRAVQARFPEVVVIDGRSSGYDSALFVDATHLDRQGSMAFSAAVADAMGTGRGGASSGSRWVDLPAYSDRPIDVPVEDLAQSQIALGGGDRGPRR